MASLGNSTTSSRNQNQVSDFHLKNVEFSDSRPEGYRKETSLFVQDIFELAANERRRNIVRYLEAHPDEDEFDLSDIARDLRVMETEDEEVNVSSDERKSVYTTVYQMHLPMMDELGIVEILDGNNQVVRDRYEPKKREELNNGTNRGSRFKRGPAYETFAEFIPEQEVTGEDILAELLKAEGWASYDGESSQGSRFRDALAGI